MENAYGTFTIAAYVDKLEVNDGETANENLQKKVVEALESCGIHCDWIERTTEVIDIKGGE